MANKARTVEARKLKFGTEVDNVLYIYIYIYIYIYTHTHTHIYIYCVCINNYKRGDDMKL